MFLKSIRFKILLWYILFLTITLSIFSVLLYEGFNHFIYGNLEDLLSSRAEGVADSIKAYWTSPQGGRNIIVMPNDDNIKNFIAAAGDWVEEKRKDPELMSVFVRILNTKRECLVATKLMPDAPLLSQEDFNDIVKGEDSFDTVSWNTPEGKNMQFRMYSKPAMENGKTMYVVQVAAPVDLLSLALGNLKVILFLLLPLTIVLAALPSVFLVNITLRPVDGMTRTLKQITAENLKLKIHMPDTKDEIKRLADTFNDMIARLDRSFSSHQRFIQDISRELRVPVNTLSEEMRLALAKNCSVDEYKALLLKSLKETDDFSRIIDNLSILSQFADEMPVLEIKKINLTNLVENAFNDMKALAAEKDINTSLACIETIKIDGDRKQILQLLASLFDNAVRYTYRKGNINVTVRKEGKFAKIIISDTGIGMPEEELPYIFDRFYQVAKPRGIKGGFGLGLSAAKSIVEAHKGTIDVESQEGKGSIFTISLPITYLG